MKPTKIKPGSPEHFALLGVPMGWNFLTGKDFADMQAFALAVWNASRAALSAQAAQPVAQEPMGWATHHEPPMLFPMREEAALHCDDDEEPIALAPRAAQAAVPMSEEELLGVLKSLDAETKRLPPGFVRFARAIERHHGIGSQA